MIDTKQFRELERHAIQMELRRVANSGEDASDVVEAACAHNLKFPPGRFWTTRPIVVSWHGSDTTIET